MDKKKNIKNIIKIVITNGLIVMAGVLMGFAVPKILSIDDYAIYKTFTLYSSYTALFHLGIVDGIGIIYGAYDYDDIDKRKMRTVFRVFFSLEVIVSLIFAVVFFFCFTGIYRIVFSFLALYLLVYNSQTYFQCISEITQRINELSIKNLVQAFANIIFIVAIWLLKHFGILTNVNAVYFCVFLVVLNSLFLLVYVIRYRDLVFGKANPVKSEFKTITSIIKVGLPALITNLCTALILSLDRQFVQLLYDSNSFAIYSFAYSMITLISSIIGAVSSVFFPILKRLSDEDRNVYFQDFLSYISMIIGICLVSYPILAYIVIWFLPAYVDSLVIFKVLLPGLLLSCSVHIIIQNYFKAYGKVNLFFIISLVVLGISALGNFIAYYFFKETFYLSIASVITLAIYFLITGIYMSKYTKTNLLKNLLYLVLIITSFYLSTLIPLYYLCGIAYLGAFIIITIVLFHNELLTLIRHRKTVKEDINNNIEEK